MKLPEAKTADRLFWALLALQIVAVTVLFFIWSNPDHKTLRLLLIILLFGTGPATLGAILMGFASENRRGKTSENKSQES
jgi:hypothetical protein